MLALFLNMPKTGKKKVSKKNVMKAKSNFLKSKTSTTSDCGFAGAEEQKLIPRGTFGGTIYQLGFFQDSRIVAADTGDQGGGQN